MASKDQNIPQADTEMEIPKVFISYNHKDQEVALKIKDRLESAGIEVIIDLKAMATGENIEGFIKRCIKESGITLSLISANSLMSAWVAMETIWSSYDETLRGRYFMPCTIDNSFFKRSFTDQALDELDEQIKEIDNAIQIRLQKGRGIEDLTDERTLINHLIVELPSIIGKLKNSLCVNLNDENFDRGIEKVINDIKNSLNIKALTDPIENQTKLSNEQHGKKQLQKAEQQNKFQIADEIKMGRILYKIADTMQLNRTERCEIRIAKNEISEIELLVGLDDNKVKIEENVKVSDNMEVQLIPSHNNAFRIVGITEQAQFLDDDSFTQWIFDVTPIETGNQLLTLVISIIKWNNHDEKIKKNVVFERIINVITSEGELKPIAKFEKVDLINSDGNNNISAQNSTNSSVTINVNSSDNNQQNVIAPNVHRSERIHIGQVQPSSLEILEGLEASDVSKPSARLKKIIYLLIPLMLIAFFSVAYYSKIAPYFRQIFEQKKQDKVSSVELYPKKVEPTKPESTLMMEAKRDSIAKFTLKDERFYKNAIPQNTIEAFNEYIKAFPGGLYIKQAKQKIDSLQIVKRQKRINADNAGAKERKQFHIEEIISTENEANKALNLQMIFVKGGEFIMGDDSSNIDDEKPAHKVVVSDFHISKCEVNQKQWAEIMGNNPSRYKGCNNCPVENVSWDDVQEFIKKLNQKTGLAYRLPTEAEWEYAAGGGSVTARTKWGGTNNEDELGNYAWFSGNSVSKTHPGGTKKPNSLGICDMIGNVWEWCNDRYAPNYYRNSPLNDPKGPSSGSYRVVRGGSWLSDAAYSRVAYRLNFTTDFSSDNYGFRILLP